MKNTIHLPIVFIFVASIWSQHVFSQNGPLNGSGGGIIAFTSDRDGNQEIYLMNADGTTQTNVTHSSVLDMGGRWSPDGNRLAFVSTRDGGFEIYIMDVIDITNGIFSQPQRITNNGYMEFNITWSPEGTKIAFDTQVNGVSGIYIYDLVAGGAFQHLDTTPVDGFQPSWSPVNDTIAFGSSDGLYTIHTDGSNLFQLTVDFVNMPVWSPDGSKIAYVSGTPDEDIYIINADGTGNVLITTNPANDFVPSWSPDGSMFVYEDDRNGHDEIYTIDVFGWNPTRLTNQGTNTEPCWRLDPNATIVDDKTNQSIPQTIKLHQNYPNPFNPTTIIGYQLSREGFVSIKVYDIIGKEIAVLVNEVKLAGNYKIEFDGKKVTNGVYFYQLKTDRNMITKKMIFLK